MATSSQEAEQAKGSPAATAAPGPLILRLAA